MSGTILLPTLLLVVSSALGQTVTIGVTDFPLGENAFPNASECLDAAGCGSTDNVLVDATDPFFSAVSAARALRGHRLGLVALDLDATDEIRLAFPVPIVNQPGADIYAAQVLFINSFDGLGDAQGINDVGIRFGATGAWNDIPLDDFTGDLSLFGPVFVTYQDPELKQDAYGVQERPSQPPLAGLWFVKLDLSDFGLSADAEVQELTIRGSTNLGNSGLDAVIVGNLKAGGTGGNSAPLAHAGRDQTALVGTMVQLDGSGSSDIDGDTLTFSWALLTAPAENNAVLSDVTAVTPSFTVDRPGDYLVQLLVNDGLVDSAPDTVTVSTQNSAPLADTGPGQTALVGTMVQLDGTGSSDIDGDALTFSWALLTLPAGSKAVLSDITAPMPSFDVDRPGTYLVQLVVNDGLLDSAPDTVTVSTQNSAPLAAAGPGQTTLVGAMVQLDGTGSSDVDGDTLTFSWALLTTPAGSNAVLSDVTVPMPSFDVDRAGTYLVQLVVNDGLLDSAPDTVGISARSVFVLSNSSGGGSLAVRSLLLLVVVALVRGQGRPKYKRRSLLHVHKVSVLVLLSLIAAPQQTAEAANYRLKFGGDFTLSDHNGNPYSLLTARGKVVIIFFGFTTCVDICPTTLLKISDAMRRLGSLSAQVQPLLITVDTKRDTLDALRQYVTYFHPAVIGLTGTQDEVESVAGQYRAPVLVRKPNEYGYYVVDHSSKLFLVDRDGGLANILSFEASAEDIADHVRELLEQ
jgi:cytochrome oxidase Cu insertion factor (SCO1/SenC/PrrC family)